MVHSVTNSSGEAVLGLRGLAPVVAYLVHKALCAESFAALSLIGSFANPTPAVWAGVTKQFLRLWQSAVAWFVASFSLSKIIQSRRVGDQSSWNRLEHSCRTGRINCGDLFHRAPWQGFSGRPGSPVTTGHLNQNYKIHLISSATLW